LAVPGDTTPMAELMPRLVAGGVRSVSPSGILGDPTGASALEGAAFLDTMVEGVVERILAARSRGHGARQL
ncbi:MAG: mycofactocin system creatininase, partial [Frondihabitans sp.]|nr:mycofactocin system creatininase [Frondihabitans sp.]